METLRQWLYSVYGPVQRAIAPGLRNSQHLYKDCLWREVRSDTVWLDLGCGHQLLPDWMTNADQIQHEIVGRCRLAIGIDADHANLRRNRILAHKLRGDIEQLPFPDSVFDLVTANVVVEHIEDPSRLLSEIRRVLKPKGKFVFYTPNFWGYATLSAWVLPRPLRVRLVYLLQGRREEDVFPTFYRFNTPGTIRHLATQSGFRIAELQLVETSALTVMLGPVVLLELIWIALLRLDALKYLRTNILCALQKV